MLHKLSMRLKTILSPLCTKKVGLQCLEVLTALLVEFSNQCLPQTINSRPIWINNSNQSGNLISQFKEG